MQYYVDGSEQNEYKSVVKMQKENVFIPRKHSLPYCLFTCRPCQILPHFLHFDPHTVKFCQILPHFL